MWPVHGVDLQVRGCAGGLRAARSLAITTVRAAPTNWPADRDLFNGHAWLPPAHSRAICVWPVSEAARTRIW
jgi:hypothetical protein